MHYSSCFKPGNKCIKGTNKWKKILTFSVRLVADGNQNYEQNNDREVDGENGTGSRVKSFGSHPNAGVLRCCKDDFQRKKIAFAYLQSQMMDEAETGVSDKSRRCYLVEQVVVNERWWRRAFPLLQEWTGVAQSDIADVVYTGYAVGIFVGGFDIFFR